jgi:hypothetical protein
MRYFRFSLKSLLIIFTVISIVLGMRVIEADSQRRARTLVGELGGGGNLSLANGRGRQEVEELSKLLPNVKVLGLNYSSVADAGLLHGHDRRTTHGAILHVCWVL